jgi:very-short-patch-repair endonuclease
MHLPYNKNLTANAKTLRNNQTDEEKKLWYQYLSSYPIRFLRQKVIDNCILDFYCAKCRLGIELDGNQHFTEKGIGHDTARTELLNAYGVTVLRFTNDQIRNDFCTVCRKIDEAVKALVDSHNLKQPLPTRPY